MCSLRLIVSAAMAGILLLAACSSAPQSGETAALPDLPELQLEQFSPEIRDRASDLFQQAREQPEDASIVGRLGMFLQAHEQYQSAAACYERAARLDQDSFRWRYYWGVALSQIGSPEEARRVLEEALQKDPSHVPTSIRLADALLASGNLSRSRTLYEAIVREHPDVAAGHFGVGQVFTAEDMPERAVAPYRRAAELSGGAGAVHYALALAHRRTGDQTAAEQHMALYQSSPGGPRLLFDDPLMVEVERFRIGSQHYHLQRGRQADASGNVEEALEEYLRAAEVDPAYVQAHINLMSAYGKLGDYQSAEKHYRKAVRINPNLEEAHYNFGVLCFSQKRHREAVEAFRQALRLNPNSAEAHNNLGFVLEELGNTSEAFQHYQAAIENKPNYRLAHFHMGRHLVARERHREAIRHLQQTLSPEDEQTTGFLLALARVYRRAGETQKATASLQRARQVAARFQQNEAVAMIDKELRAGQR